MEQARHHPGQAIVWHQRPETLKVTRGLAMLLTETGSLTVRLREHFGPLRVRVLSEAACQPDAESMSLLACRSGDDVHERRVHLVCSGVPRVCARTLVSGDDLHRRADWFTRLGDNPLGDTLFAHPDTRRHSLEFALLPAAHPHRPLFTGLEIDDVDRELVMRRSVLVCDGCRFLIQECFLPGVES